MHVSMSKNIHTKVVFCVPGGKVAGSRDCAHLVAPLLEVLESDDSSGERTMLAFNISMYVSVYIFSMEIFS